MNGQRIAIVTVFLLSAALIGGCVTGGSVRGIEWSPDLLRHRSFNYGVMYVDLQVTPTTYDEWESDFDVWMKQQPYFPAATGAPRWYFIKGQAPQVRGWSGSAKSVCKAVGCWGGDSHSVIEWSEAHPALAADLWPTVFKTIRTHESMSADAARFIRGAMECDTAEEYALVKQAFDEELQLVLAEMREYGSPLR